MRAFAWAWGLLLLGVFVALGGASRDARAGAPSAGAGAASAGAAAVAKGDVSGAAVGAGGAGAVTLDVVLEWAGEHAPALAVARARLAYGAAAVAGARPVFGGANPSLEVEAGPRVALAGDGGARPTADVAVALLVPLEVAGERGLRLESAHAQEAVARARVGAAEVALRFEIAGAWREAVVAGARAAAAERLAVFAGDV
ncbi:MAG TPA: hypothetical protein VG389_27535, partial [Myxococcota bacterium]|nr:hypothetical protein [Myxococcota bacterium]